ncbi:hypothetical protein [Jeotgalibacillus soli]|uniref:Uncharacterized protein n=1 Tax=Jeotgalibacillus soli TaxID=889306 RepID=A0A0C2R5D9_9BACL|nr:hypothetical protein [Jeotgalibacillus soli]KIL45470.1 hypothetical protein KP78_30140 [Jeotgalibacillus soli]
MGMKGYFSAARLMGVVLFLITSLVATGCSENGTVSKGASDKNAEAIRAVIEKEFSAPDEEFQALRDAALESVKEAGDQKEYDELMEAPVYKEYLTYMEDTYRPYFTENGYDSFISTASAFMYSGLDGDFSLSPSDIKIEQSDSSSALYNFTFHVKAESGNGVAGDYYFEGKANVPEEGRIGTIEFSDKDSLYEKLNSSF